ncbi:hypothetical protein AMJ83_03965 [candidate division WOR_3 bacterium SM23_42]|uniref:4Fe-4S Mo/W bis-MGD-type domain-containing protein n=1 Tax=candidate division WOR_3 bacterium SM23_42 TaxID=1703779 RepID=A0A0S8FTT8_UNCW3|nr:MAG: hypothetical protein AMJ83_03965 [candidate division WOR_3 bacterium SM23_42]
MKNIDPKAVVVKRALCPFCSFGCEFGVIFNDFGVAGVEYIKDGSSGGRLCPRGSAAAMYLDHPRRLSTPMKNSKAIEWSRMAKELRKVIGNPKNVAVTFDRNVTLEEYASIIGFCKKNGIDDISSTYFEPEAYLKPFLDKPFATKELDKAQLVLILGDPFNHAPMSSQSIIDWKLSNKKNNLLVIDSINTHTAGFADTFLRVAVGTEPLLLFGLAQEKIDGVDIAKATGIDAEVIADVSKAIKAAEGGLIFACLSFGHTYDARLLVEGLMRLRKFSGMRVVPFVEFTGYGGSRNFATILEKVKKKKIKNLINFGELFPFYYPQLNAELKGSNIYATSTFKYTGDIVLPVPFNLEKKGTVITTFGKKELNAGIEPPSGAKSISEILNMLDEGPGKGEVMIPPEGKMNITESARKLVQMSLPKKKGYRLIGEKIAYSFLGFFESEALKVNPRDAAELGLKENDLASVTSKHGSVDFPVRLTTDVDKGIVAVSAETPDVKGLFEYEINTDSNIVNFIPTEVKICRKE